MGCCLSKDPGFNKNPPSQFPHSSRRRPFPESDPHLTKAPLSPVFEEESVKEVLSETPNPKPKPQPQPQPQPQPEPEPKPKQVQALLKKEEEEEDGGKNKIPIAEFSPSVPKIVEEEKKMDVVLNNVATEEYSEVSEICSLSESQSLSTTTMTERRDDEDGEVQQPRVHRSPAKVLRKRSIPGDFVGKHERGSKSPARRLNPSPGRRNDTNSDVGQTQATRRRIAENNRARRDPGERSGRRSRSPATRANPGINRSGIGRSPSRKAPRSPARIPAVAPETERKVDNDTKDENQTNESIENPLVSLECFIFL